MHMLRPTSCYSAQANSQFVTAPFFWAAQGSTFKFEAVQSASSLGRSDSYSQAAKIAVECLTGLASRRNGKCWSFYVIFDTAIEFFAIFSLFV